VTTRVEIVFPRARRACGCPSPRSIRDTRRSFDNAWSGNAQTAKIAYDGKYGAGHALRRVAHRREESGGRALQPLRHARPRRGLSARAGIGRETLARAARVLHRIDRAHAHRRHREEDGADITQGARSDYDKAKAIYEWIVDNTYRDPKTRGCGVGDIKTMLETGNLGGKCADLNALYVGLAARGEPAGARRLWRARSEIAVRLQESGSGHGEHHARASIAGPRSISPDSAGCRWDPPT